MPILTPLVERYRFLKFPQKPEELIKVDNFEFNDGTYKSRDGDELIVNLKVYNDGFIVDSRSSTTDCDAFLHDLLTWAAKDYGLLPYAKLIRRKLYTSELYVHMEKPIGPQGQAMKKFSGFTMYPMSYWTSMRVLSLIFLQIMNFILH